MWFNPTRSLRCGAAAIALALMLAFLGTPPVQRTQEARVLATAREMLDRGARGWIIPHLNGAVRLEKPPLAYWLAVGAYKIGGVSEGVGRVPFALAGWATLLLTFATAKWLGSERAAYLSAAVLLGSMMFARHARLAETDVLATLTITAAIACIWRGAHHDESAGSGISQANWFRFSGVMVGLAAMSKGLPAAFIGVFLLLLAAVNRDRRLVWRWIASGAAVPAILIGAPWFICAGALEGWSSFRNEAVIGLAGKGHSGSPLSYFPELARAMAPWTGLAVLAAIVLGYHWRADWRARGLFAWFAAVFIPLLCARQRQFHYLMPAIPAAAIMTAWVLNWGIARTTKDWKHVRWLTIATAAVLVAGAAAIPLIGHLMREQIIEMDWVLAGTGLITGAVVLVTAVRSLAAGICALAAFACIAMTIIAQVWGPSLRPSNPRTIAAEIQRLGPGPYCFYGENISLPLVFYMEQTMQRAETSEELAQAMARSSSLIVVAQTKSGVAPPPVPAGLERAAEIRSEDQTFAIYRVRQ